MTSRSEKRPAEFYEKGYEPNDIRLKGIVYFAVGLVILIVITFGLMWALLGVMEDQMSYKKDTSPMAMSEKERLPPEPRLQSAPGFGVDSPDGRINLELREPSAEYREMRREWDQKVEKGIVDPSTGAILAMPIDVAKEKLLEENVKAASGPDAENALIDSRMYISDSSAGRLASEKRR
ncbi:MAG: hypothetical protein ACREO5_01940 [Candidatus Binatia bacterium]